MGAPTVTGEAGLAGKPALMEARAPAATSITASTRPLCHATSGTGNTDSACCCACNAFCLFALSAPTTLSSSECSCRGLDSSQSTTVSQQQLDSQCVGLDPLLSSPTCLPTEFPVVLCPTRTSRIVYLSRCPHPLRRTQVRHRAIADDSPNWDCLQTPSALISNGLSGAASRQALRAILAFRHK